MAEACVLQWAPDSLYNTSISTIVTYYSKHRKDLKSLPEDVQFDIYYKLYNKGRLCELATEISDLDSFIRILRVKNNRHLMHRCFQAVMDHGQPIAGHLSDAFCQRCSLLSLDDTTSTLKYIQQGLSIGCFLSEAGWFSQAERVLLACLQLSSPSPSTTPSLQTLECCVQLLHVRNVNCCYHQAQEIWDQAQDVVASLEAQGHVINKACLYSEFSQLLFARSQYDDAYKFCCKALKEVHTSLPPKTVVDVFRQSAKACVVKREIKKAELLIKFAVQHAREHFGMKHPKYSDALMDYGFYLLNVDAVAQAVKIYQTSLDIRIAVFGGNNLHVALAYEDLAYSSYVHEYSTGKFQDAKDHASKAIEIITNILPSDHLLLASSKRVIALILEEIAIDSHDKEEETRLLHEAEDLHLSSLALAMKAFGENNVQTAKHYGNLGRLYQSMHRYQEAEQMHLKAIAIKDRLLGPDDYEVALSIGHLASLYNYDMNKYEDAEQLYMRSIATGLKLFGQGYSGLEYDYRGLQRLYHNMGNFQKAFEYGTVLHEWNQIRDQSNAEEHKPLDFSSLENCEQVVECFYHLSGV